MHPIFGAEYLRRVKATLERAADAGAVDHHGLVGRFRELLVNELLAPLTGPHVGFGAGKIVDHLGNESAEIDVILYDKRSIPPMVFGTAGASGLYPVEACIYAIETKSKATGDELEDAVGKAKSVDSLVFVPELRVAGVPRDRVINALFAFDSNMTTDPINERDRWMAATSQETALIAVGATSADIIAVPALRVVCVAGRGYGYYNAELASYGWSNAEGNHSEILWFMAGVANTLGLVSSPRRAAFGHYFLPGTPPSDQPFGSESRDQFRQILLDLAARERRFDANDATGYILGRLSTARGTEEPIANVEDILAVIEEMEESGDLARIEGDPPSWEYTADA